MDNGDFAAKIARAVESELSTRDRRYHDAMDVAASAMGEILEIIERDIPPRDKLDAIKEVVEGWLYS